MKIRFVFLLLFISFLSGAQTGLIAHKSHSGSEESYVFAEFGNFGGPEISPLQLSLPTFSLYPTSIEKINDTTVIFIRTFQDAISKDTIYNHPLFSDPNMTVDSLKKSFFNDVEFTNFEKKDSDNESENALSIPIEQETSKAISKKQQRKAKRNNSWVILLIIGGGTFVGFGWMTTNLRRRKLNVLLVKA